MQHFLRRRYCLRQLLHGISGVTLLLITWLGFHFAMRRLGSHFLSTDSIFNDQVRNMIKYAGDVLFMIILFAFVTARFLKFKTKHILINLAFIIVILYLFELMLFVKDPFYKLPFDSLYYENNLFLYEGRIKPLPDVQNDVSSDSKFYTWGHLVKNNRFGFREKEIDSVRIQKAYKIMILGDSFTWGVGLSVKDRYSDRLDSLLSCIWPDIEVLNFSKAGFSTVRERDVLYSLAPEVKPDLIIVGFCYNDPQPKSEGYNPEGIFFYEKYGSIIEAIKCRMAFLGLRYIAVLAESALYDILERCGVLPRWYEALNRTYRKEAREWKEFLNALRDIKQLADSLNQPPPFFVTLNYVLGLPLKVSGWNKKIYDLQRSWLAQARDAARSLGYRVIDTDPSLMAAVKSGRINSDNVRINELDNHPGAVLHEIYAHVIFDKLIPILSEELNNKEKAIHNP